MANNTMENSENSTPANDLPLPPGMNREQFERLPEAVRAEFLAKQAGQKALVNAYRVRRVERAKAAVLLSAVIFVIIGIPLAGFIAGVLFGALLGGIAGYYTAKHMLSYLFSTPLYALAGALLAGLGQLFGTCRLGRESFLIWMITASLLEIVLGWMIPQWLESERFRKDTGY